MADSGTGADRGGVQHRVEMRIEKHCDIAMTSLPPDSNLPVANAVFVARRLGDLRDYQFSLESTERRDAIRQADQLLNRIRSRDRFSN